MDVNKILRVVLFLTGAISAAGQEVTEGQAPPGVVIIGLRWSRGISPPGRFEPQPYDASRADPSGTLPDQSRPARPAPPGLFQPGGRLPYYYTYSLTVSDGGGKRVRALAWEHIFADRVTGQVLARRRLASREKKGGARKTATFRATSASPPPEVISARGAAVREHAPYAERAEIMCVHYEDGTSWERPGAQGDGCEGLRQWKARKEERRRR